MRRRHNPYACSILVLFAAFAAPVGQAAPAGRGEGVPEWTVQYGGFKHLDDVAQSGADSAWAVDQYKSPESLNQTAFVRYEDGIWRVTQVADNVMLGAVAFAAPNGAMAVGQQGAASRWNGSGWQPVPTGTTQDLLDVSLSAPDAGWACGGSGTLLRWDGRSWRPYPLPFYLSLASVSSCVARPAGDAWATSLTGKILYFAGDNWQEVKAPDITQPVEIAFSPGGRALVVGRGALELVGGAWRTVGDASKTYRSAAFVGEQAYLVENDRLVQLVDGRIEPVTLAPGPGDLAHTRFERLVGGPAGAWALSSPGRLAWLAAGTATYRWPVATWFEGLDMLDPATGWAGGRAVLGGFVGRSPAGWAMQADPDENAVVWDVDLVSADDGWAASFDPDLPGTMQMWRWGGQRWAPWPIDKTWRLSRLQMLSATDGWAAGGNVIVRWRGSEWEALPGTPAGAAGVLSMLRGGDDPLGWFGGSGTIFQLSGSTWTPSPLPVQEPVRAVDVPVVDRGWAVTANHMLDYDGVGWQQVDAPKPAGSTYVDLDAVSTENVWVLLSPPALLHWTGLTWEFHDLAPLGGNARPLRLRAVLDPQRPDHTDIWLAGSPPVVARYRVLTLVSQMLLPALFKP